MGLSKGFRMAWPHSARPSAIRSDGVVCVMLEVVLRICPRFVNNLTKDKDAPRRVLCPGEFVSAQLRWIKVWCDKATPYTEQFRAKKQSYLLDARIYICMHIYIYHIYIFNLLPSVIPHLHSKFRQGMRRILAWLLITVISGLGRLLWAESLRQIQTIIDIEATIHTTYRSFNSSSILQTKQIITNIAHPIKYIISRRLAYSRITKRQQPWHHSTM